MPPRSSKNSKAAAMTSPDIDIADMFAQLMAYNKQMSSNLSAMKATTKMDPEDRFLIDHMSTDPRRPSSKIMDPGDRFLIDTMPLFPPPYKRKATPTLTPQPTALAQGSPGREPCRRLPEAAPLPRNPSDGLAISSPPSPTFIAVQPLPKPSGAAPQPKSKPSMALAAAVHPSPLLCDISAALAVTQNLPKTSTVTKPPPQGLQYCSPGLTPSPSTTTVAAAHHLHPGIKEKSLAVNSNVKQTNGKGKISEIEENWIRGLRLGPHEDFECESFRYATMKILKRNAWIIEGYKEYGSNPIRVPMKKKTVKPLSLRTSFSEEGENDGIKGSLVISAC